MYLVSDLALGLGFALAPPRPALGTEAAEAVGHVVGLGIGPQDPLEVLARPGHVAGALVEVGQQVPLPQVAVRGVPQRLRRPGGRQHGDRPVEVTVVGQRGRGHDPTLGQDVGVR